MIEYKVVNTTVKQAEETMNQLAQEGWQVIATNAIAGQSFTIGSTPLIVTFGRKI
ncbi:MAG: DUF4177 domain-containing protein [Clostridia bacterium]|nr:DUF4177 domain-containing protein [Clostridia bacterium]